MVTSLTVFTLLYVVLAVVEVRLMARYAKAGPALGERPPATDPRLRGGGSGDGGPGGGPGDGESEQMIFAY